VKALAARLRTQGGVDVTLDQWAAVPGDQLPAFMETAVRENDFVLVVCNARYRDRSNRRAGGVGYEGDIMTGEVMNFQNRRKFIPLLREGEAKGTLPSWLLGSYYLDFRGDPYPESSYQDLVRTLHSARTQAPPVGARPDLTGGRSA